MNQSEFVRECTLGGPGLSGYAYNADVYCVECGEKIAERIASTIAPRLADTSDWRFSSSEHVPCPIFFGESPDCRQHCADCGEYLYGEDSEED